MTRTALVAVVGIGVLVAGCQGPGTPLTSPTAGSRPSATQRSTTGPAEITLPAVAGRNGQIVHDELRALGLKHVTFASQDPKAKVPILLGNWTAVKIEPPAGTVVKPTDTVVVTLTKHG